MKITFILPAIGKKDREPYLKGWGLEPLTIATLYALTPPEFEVEFFDDRKELIDYQTKTDIVAITSETYTAKRAYYIASIFRKRGVPVVMGGFHPTLMSDEAIEHADYVIKGNAENIWVKFLYDFIDKKANRLYQGSLPEKIVFPNRQIYKNKKYLPVLPVETSRGCCFNCEFCAVSTYYCSKYMLRDIDDVIKDIILSNKKFIIFTDDNLTMDRNRSIDLFKKLEKLKIKWFAQSSILAANDEELLYYIKKSGCLVLLIGFESINKENLSDIRKTWMNSEGDPESLIKKIHKQGINIYANFVLGFDRDNQELFKDTLDFALRQNFLIASFNHLLPYPGTDLYKRLMNEKRLYFDQWWLADDYRYGEIPFYPKMISREELAILCDDIRRKYYKTEHIVKRGYHIMKRNFSPVINYLYWTQNYNFKKEVSGRKDIKLGANLDELPK